MTWLAFVVSASERWIRRDDIYRFDAPRLEAKSFVTVFLICARLLGYNTLKSGREHNYVARNVQRDRSRSTCSGTLYSLKFHN